MNRRQFLRSAAIGIAATQVKPLYALAPEVTPGRIITHGNITLDLDKQIVGLSETAPATCTGSEFYGWLKDAWRENDELVKHPFPMTAITPEIYQMETDHTIDPAMSRSVKNATIIEDDGYYLGMVQITAAPDFVEPLWLQRDAKPASERIGMTDMVRLNGDERLLRFITKDRRVWMDTNELGFKDLSFRPYLSAIRLPSPQPGWRHYVRKGRV